VADPYHQRVLDLGRRNAERSVPRYRSLLLHWLGRTIRRPRRVTTATLPPVEAGQVAVTWGGHSTVLVRTHDLSVLCDPMLGRSVHGVKREVAAGLSDRALESTNLVLLSHVAPDHLHLPTLKKVPRAATVVVPQRTAPLVSPLGFARLVELAVGESIDHRGLHVEATPVKHGDRDHPAQSYVLRGDGPSLFFCGASGYFDGFARIGERYQPDVALLPIAGYWPPSFRERHMSPIDALYAFEDLRARLMIPIGHGTFALSYELLRDPERWMADLVRAQDLDGYVVRLQPGESRVFVAPAPPGVDLGFDPPDPDDTGVDTDVRSPAGIESRAPST
jgi:L-ascorbate metabolism protein UlaG (beta-lactamase superfamily)